MEPDSGHDPGLPDFGRIFKKVKGEHRDAPTDFQVTPAGISPRRRHRRRFSMERVGLLLIWVWVVLVLASLAVRFVYFAAGR